jgi:hypothetical protein
VQQRTSTPEGALKKGSKVCISPAINNEVIMLITTGGNHQDKRVAKQRDPRKSATQDQRLFAVWFSMRTNMQAGVSPEVLKLQFYAGSQDVEAFCTVLFAQLGSQFESKGRQTEPNQGLGARAESL